MLLAFAGGEGSPTGSLFKSGGNHLMKTHFRGWARAATIGRLLLGMVILMTAGGGTSSWAANKFWTGTSGNWNTAANWSPAGAPVNGDDLYFPSLAAGRFRNTTNNIPLPARRFASINFTDSGYFVRGNPVVVSNGITSLIDTGVNTFNLDVTLAAHQTFANLTPIFSMTGTINLSGFNLTVDAGEVGRALLLSGALTGSGDIRKIGLGYLNLGGSAANTYAGQLRVSFGELRLSKTPGLNAVTGPLTVDADARVQWFLSDQVADDATITVGDGAFLSLNGQNETVGPLDLTSATVDSGTGLLKLNGNVTTRVGFGPTYIRGRLDLGDATRILDVADSFAEQDLVISAAISGGARATPPLGVLVYAGLQKEGSGWLVLRGTNSYAGGFAANAGRVRVEANGAFGINPPVGFGGSVIINHGGYILLANVDVTTKTLVINQPTPSVSLASSGDCSWGGPLVLNTNVVFTGTGGILALSNSISGPGGLALQGDSFRLAGNQTNTFAGDLAITYGRLELAKSGVPAILQDRNLLIGGSFSGLPGAPAEARLLGSFQIEGPVTVDEGSVLDLNGFSDSLPGLTLIRGGDVQTGAGTLILQGDLRVIAGSPLPGARSAISGRLRVDGAPRTFHIAELGDPNPEAADLELSAILSGDQLLSKVGPGDLLLSGDNTPFVGSIVVREGDIYIEHPKALGSAAGSTRVEGSARLGLRGGIAVIGESLTLDSLGRATDGQLRSISGSNTWTGPIVIQQEATLRAESGAILNLESNISGPSGLTKIGPGILAYSGAGRSTYVGVTQIKEGTLVARRLLGDDRAFNSDVIVGEDLGDPGSAVLRLEQLAQIRDDARVTLRRSGRMQVLDAETIGSLLGRGEVVLANDSILELGFNHEDFTFDGLIGGNGTLGKTGVGITTLTANNTYTGPTLVTGGTLKVNGAQEPSPVTVWSGATLTGSGRVGNLTVQNLGNVVPKVDPRPLNAGTTTLEPGSNLRIALNGPTQVRERDQLAVRGPIDLNGAQLVLTRSPGYAPADGDELVIISNLGSGPILGTFAGLPEGSVLVRDGLRFHLTYVGGSGHDVSLVVTNVGLRYSSTRVDAGNGNGVIDPNECDHLFIALENRTGAAIGPIQARLDSGLQEIAITQAESAYASIPPLGFGTNSTPFQIRVPANLVCGRPIPLSLVVSAPGQGTFAIPFLVPSGSEGLVQTVGSTNIPKQILSLQTTNSTIVVTNEFIVARVDVSFHLTHPSVGDLRIALMSPTREVVLLSSNHGGTGDNFGSSCASRTVFRDTALIRIAAGSAPYVGAFAPDEPLSRFAGLSALGAWSLLVEDSLDGDDGALQCWSLTFHQASCQDGGGECESCITVAGTLDASSPTVADRPDPVDLTPSGCGNIRPCPGTTTLRSLPPYHYQVHAFTNLGPETCVTAVLDVPCAGYQHALFATAYLNHFNPTDRCSGYLGDSGNLLIEGPRGFSFRVPAGAVFEIMVQEMNLEFDTAGCDRYRLQIYGLPCPPPTLAIDRTDRTNYVRLSWSTAYPEFTARGRDGLEGIPPSTFTVGSYALPDPLSVVDGRYVVTNKATAPRRFYELVK